MFNFYYAEQKIIIIIITFVNYYSFRFIPANPLRE